MKNKSIKIVCLIFCFIVLSMSFTGCGKDKRKLKAGEVYLYYTDKDQTKLTSVNYKVTKETTLEKAREVIRAMNETSNKLNVITAIPDKVSVLKVSLTDDVVNVDFDADYYEMNKVEELLCRAAVVLTVTQIEDVNYVLFTVNGDELVDSNNNEVGTMKSSDFIDMGNSNINSFSEISCELYYATLDGKKLTTKTYNGVYEENTSMEEIIINKLISGPTDTDCVRTLPINTKLISVMTKDGICYVNFDSSFLNEATDVSPKIEIYSIVNSLVELSYINKVQISVNGSSNKKLRDEISLEYAFTRNLDLVKS